MKVVYKYPVPFATPAVVAMPKYARILHVGSQNNEPVLWAEVETTQPAEQREFFVYGTGHPVTEEGLTYLGSTQTELGLVWHLYERPIDRNLGEVLMDAVGRGE